MLKFLGYFWGPIPWMIEVAVILSAGVGHWPDFDQAVEECAHHARSQSAGLSCEVDVPGQVPAHPAGDMCHGAGPFASRAPG
ncbi:MAG: hypothetical protein WCF36_08345 [Candidatus Nanopelagicales bacterium]